MLKVGTLFSGGLAAVEFALRYEELEHEIVFACEWDKFARKQYEHFHGLPTSCFYEDVSFMDGTPYRDTLDLMVWGSPCQDLSLAGKRKGFDGVKSSLFREGARIMSEVMPKAFIFENVKGLLSSNGGADYAEVIKTFQDMGYLIAVKVMNTKDYGVPQNRERVFIVGFLDDGAYHTFSFEDGFQLETRLKHYLDESVDEKYYLSSKMTEYLDGAKRSVKPGSVETKFSPCLLANYHKTPTDGFYLQEPLILDDYNSKIKYDGIACTLTQNCGAMARRNGQKVLEPNNKGYIIRKLTPKECFKLQGVKDSCIEKIYKNIILHFPLIYDKINLQEIKEEFICNVKLKDAKEKQTPKNMGISALCTTKEYTKLAQLMKHIELSSRQTIAANIVIEKLAVRELEECAINTIKWTDCIPTLYMLMTEENCQGHKVILETRKADGSIEKLWKITLEENLSEERLFTTLIALKQIIELKIFTYAKMQKNTLRFTANSIELKKNLLMMKLSSLKMEYIEQTNSDSSLYKIAGNAISVNVMQSLLRSLYKPVSKKDTLF